MKKIKIKKPKSKLTNINKIIITIIILILIIISIFKYINKKATPIIMEYATLEAKKLSSIIINKAISKHITEKTTTEELFQVTKDNSGEIKSIDFNTALVNKFLTETTNSVQINLRNIEKGNIDALEFSDSLIIDYKKTNLEKGIIYQVSSGVIIGNPLLANIGPKIPVKISLVGDATSNITTKITNYGINNAMIEVFVNLKINEKIILPFYNENIEIKSKAPVALKIVTGTVPEYYSKGLTQSTPSITLPNEEKTQKEK